MVLMSETTTTTDEDYDAMEAFRNYREARSQSRLFEYRRIGGWMSTNADFRQEANYEYAGTNEYFRKALRS